jgi:hypothetical protein
MHGVWCGTFFGTVKDGIALSPSDTSPSSQIMTMSKSTIEAIARCFAVSCKGCAGLLAEYV